LWPHLMHSPCICLDGVMEIMNNFGQDCHHNFLLGASLISRCSSHFTTVLASLRILWVFVVGSFSPYMSAMYFQSFCNYARSKADQQSFCCIWGFTQVTELPWGGRRGLTPKQLLCGVHMIPR